MIFLNYTSKIAPEQTISEIQKMLYRHGAAAIITEYDGPHVAALSFKMVIGGKPMAYKLPCNWRAVLSVLEAGTGQQKVYDQKDARRLYEEREAQAIRTAWRIIKDWMQTQLALVEVNMVTFPQIFLPFAIVHDGRTFAEYVETGPSFPLGDGK